MAKIYSPNKEFTGKRAGVGFIDGEAETTDLAAIDWCRRRGYEVVDDAPAAPAFPEGDPEEKWTNDQLKAYAASKDIELGEAKKKDELLAAIASASA